MGSTHAKPAQTFVEQENQRHDGNSRLIVSTVSRRALVSLSSASSVGLGTLAKINLDQIVSAQP
jgi:hypothetical protein